MAKFKRTLVIGDIHGGLLGLIQALDRCGYDSRTDRLIFTGDFVDGWSDSFKLIEFLIKLYNQAVHKPIFIIGNHDEEFMYWLSSGFHSWSWGQGALSTIMSYAEALGIEVEKYPKKIDAGYKGWHIEGIEPKDIPDSHKEFYRNLRRYYLDPDRGQLFVHGGFDPRRPIEMQENNHIYYWDRELVDIAVGFQLGKQGTIKYKDGIKEVFVGHTTTLKWGVSVPFTADTVTLMDTGGGHHGKVSVMDVNTKKFWQSDVLQNLYPYETTR